MVRQIWNSFIVHSFKRVAHALLKSHAQKLLQYENQDFQGIKVLTAEDVKRDEIIMRKLALIHGDVLLLPDFDLAMVRVDPVHKWGSEILAVISCKASFRNRTERACHWDPKLLS